MDYSLLGHLTLKIQEFVFVIRSLTKVFPSVSKNLDTHCVRSGCVRFVQRFFFWRRCIIILTKAEPASETLCVSKLRDEGKCPIMCTSSTIICIVWWFGSCLCRRGWDDVWTAANSGPIVHAPGDICALRAMVEWYWQGKTAELWEKPVSVPHWPPQISHGLTLARSGPMLWEAGD
jgi:hypothetical protein